MRSAFGRLALGACVALSGCAARTTTPVRDGWARLPTSVRLNTDAPPIAPATSDGWASDGWASDGWADARSTPADPTYADDLTYGDAGPRGVHGDVDTHGYGYGYGYGYPTYVAPGGAVAPGLRAPTDERPVGPYSAPYRSAFPSGDVTTHRPGLSTGSGIYGRGR